MATRGLFGGATYSNGYARPDASGCFRPSAAAPLPRDPYATGRGLFGVAPYSGAYRPDASTCVHAVQPTLQPPAVAFLATPDPRPPQYQARPSRDASAVMGPNTRADVNTQGIRRFFTTDIPRRPYYPLLTMIRGRAGGVAGVPVVPPPAEFLMTDPPARAMLRSDDRIFPPLFREYDPFGSGAFVATPVPWLGRYSWADASQVVPVQYPPITLPGELRRFVDLLAYQSPHRQDASAFTISQGTVTGVPLPPVPLPVELRRFLTHERAWTRGVIYYDVDASKVVGPQPADNLHPFRPPGGSTYIPTWRRRRR